MPDEVRGYVDTVRNGCVTQLEIKCVKFVANDVLIKNVETNLSKDYPRLCNREGLYVAKPEPLAIVAGGPTLKQTINEVRDFKYTLACGSVHDHLIAQGIIPTYSLVTDGVSGMKECLKNPQKETTYLIASQCEPALFDQLNGHKIEMWNFRGQTHEDPEEEKIFFRGEPVFNWGCTVTLNSISIALMLGHQHLHFFGFDSCYPDLNTTHEYDAHSAFVPDKAIVNIGRRTFITDMGMMAQAEQFYRLVEIQGRFFHSTIHGDGMIAEMARQGAPGLDQFVSLA